MKASTCQLKQSTNEQHWRAHVKAQKKSGLNRTEYCKQYNLSYHAMTYWSRKRRTAVKNKTALIPVPLKRSPQLFSSNKEHATLRVNLSRNISIEVGGNFSSGTLTRLLDVLEAR